MNSLRFTVRFRADQEEECRAAEYLKSLKHGDQNRFLVEAVLSALKSGTAASPDCRQIIREELAAALSTAVIAMPAAVEQGANISAAEQMQNDQAILDDLELFG